MEDPVSSIHYNEGSCSSHYTGDKAVDQCRWRSYSVHYKYTEDTDGSAKVHTVPAAGPADHHCPLDSCRDLLQGSQHTGRPL
jgi:hypothetical protein